MIYDLILICWLIIHISKKVFLFVDVILIVVVNATPTCIQAMSKDMSSMMGSNGILPPLFFLALSILQLVSIVTENELPMMVCTIYKNYGKTMVNTLNLWQKKSINIFSKSCRHFPFHCLDSCIIWHLDRWCWQTLLRH